MLVVVAAPAQQAAEAAGWLRLRGATVVAENGVGRGQVLVRGGPFDDASAVRTAAEIRTLGLPADVRPEGGGHLAAWQAHTRPVVVDGRLWVCFPWSEFDRNQVGEVLEIDPGRAFGTGSHPTTHLLLEALARSLRGGERVLDVGCGSGVLALAAAALGAAKVTAIDISPDALASTRSNAARNHLGKGVLTCSTPVADLPTLFDVVVANIHAEALIQLAPAIQGRMAQGAWLGLSGISPAQVSKVAAAYDEVEVIAVITEDDWSAIVAGLK